MTEKTEDAERSGDKKEGGRCAHERIQLVARLKERFLAHLALSGNVSEASRVAGVERATMYFWRRNNPEFASAWNEALEVATDALEAEARRRALYGYDELITYGGKIICDAQGQPVIKKRYSDGLLRMLLRAHRPSRFRDCGETDGGW